MLHLAGVTLVTVATLVATAGVTRATRSRADWRAWRFVAWVPFAAGALGVVSVAEMGWAKVTYVVGISVPAAVADWLIYRDAARELEDEAAAT